MTIFLNKSCVITKLFKYFKFLFFLFLNFLNCFLRFPEKGVYVLALFETALGGDLNEQQLTPFYYSLIIAEEASKKNKQFPTTYALWSASCHVLNSALRIDHFKQGVETDFEVC